MRKVAARRQCWTNEERRPNRRSDTAGPEGKRVSLWSLERRREKRRNEERATAKWPKSRMQQQWTYNNAQTKKNTVNEPLNIQEDRESEEQQRQRLYQSSRSVGDIESASYLSHNSAAHHFLLHAARHRRSHSLASALLSALYSLVSVLCSLWHEWFSLSQRREHRGHTPYSRQISSARLEMYRVAEPMVGERWDRQEDRRHRPQTWRPSVE